MGAVRRLVEPHKDKADWDQIQYIINQSWRGDPIDLPELMSQEYLSAFRDREKKIRGLLIAGPQSQGVYIVHYFYVDRDYRGRGGGTKLMDVFLDFFKSTYNYGVIYIIIKNYNLTFQKFVKTFKFAQAFEKEDMRIFTRKINCDASTIEKDAQQETLESSSLPPELVETVESS